jgi:hypothetical protein
VTQWFPTTGVEKSDATSKQVIEAIFKEVSNSLDERRPHIATIILPNDEG